MRRTKFQSAVYCIIWVLGGFLAFGAILDALGNALDLINTAVSVCITIIVSISWVLLSLFAKKKGIDWYIEGKKVRVTKVNTKATASLVGIVILAWIPTILNHKTTNQEKKITSPSVTKFDYSKIFEGSPGTFKILLLPFLPLENCTIKDTQIEKAIESRFLELNEKDNLDISVKFLDIGECPDGYDTARRIMQEAGADMVIWGDLYEQCTGDHEGCLKYVANLKLGGGKGASDVERFQLSDIKEGKLLKDVDVVVYTGIALKMLQDGRAEEIPPLLSGTSVVGQGFLPYLLVMSWSLINEKEKAMESINRLIENDPTNAKLYSIRGGLYNFAKRFEEAITDFNISERLDSKNFVYQNRASCYIQMKKYELAKDDLNMAIKAGKYLSESYYLRGLCNQYMGSPESAYVDFCKALSLEPGHYKSLNARALHYLSLSKDNKAKNDLMSIVSHPPKKPHPTYRTELLQAYINLSGIYARQKNYRQALKCISDAHKIKPNHEGSMSALGYIYYKMGRYHLSISSYTLAISKASNQASTYHERASVYEKIGEFEKALHDYDKSIALDDTYLDSLYGRGRMFNKLEYPELAMIDFISIIEIDPNYSKAYFSMGRLNQVHFRNPEIALGEYTHAISINPSYSRAYYNRGLILSSLGHGIDAINDFETFICISDNNSLKWVLSARTRINQLINKKP